MTDHYFSAAPSSGSDERPLRVVLRGRAVDIVVGSGVFSVDRLDPGTRVLLETVGDPPATGRLADVGCGWGPVALALALAAPRSTVWAIDVNPRALALTARNAESLGLGGVRALTPEAALADLGDEPLDEIWSNPPIRIGKPALHELLRTWLGRLAPDGRAHLVVQRNLGADSLHRWLAETLGADVTRTASSKGYRVLTVRPGGGS